MVQDYFSFDTIDPSLIELLSSQINSMLKDFELKTIMLGCSPLRELTEDQKKEFRKDFQFPLAKKIQESLKTEIDYQDPDANITVDLNIRTINIYIKPIYILGRYRKFARNISQTIFYCPVCKGRGCRKCEGKGVLPYESVQELISKEAIPLFGAVRDYFHGAGREDLDVRMLGNGRPFILELAEPKKRLLDLKLLESAVNEKNNGKIEISGLEFCQKENVAELKNKERSKVYSFTAESDNEITDSIIEDLKAQLGKDIAIFQSTPERVLARRSDSVRRRKATLQEVERVSSNSIKGRILADHGLYIKEFISSDNERTKPSLSSFAKVPLKCTELDVLEVI